jgi:hypothetical protein
MGETPEGYGSPEWSSVAVDGRRYQRATVQTPWLGSADDLVATMRAALDGVAQGGDTLLLTEKVAVLLTGRAVPAATVHPGRLARWLAGRVQPVGHSRGLSIPEKMQYVLDHAGRARIALAAASTALTRPFGLRGTFFRIAGSLARDLDGMRPPYLGLLLPPLPLAEARRLAEALADELGTGVAVVDINDRGGSVRAASHDALEAELLFAVLRDNPLGQAHTSTPIGLVRPDLTASLPSTPGKTSSSAQERSPAGPIGSIAGAAPGGGAMPAASRTPGVPPAACPGERAAEQPGDLDGLRAPGEAKQEQVDAEHDHTGQHGLHSGDTGARLCGSCSE